MQRQVSRCGAIALLVLGALACDDPEPATMPAPLGEAGVIEPGPKTLGAACTDSSECASLGCIRVAEGRSVCTTACPDSPAACPAAPNWVCVDVPERSSKACACRSDSTREICGDGLDNDCDGVIDCPPPDAGGTGGTRAPDPVDGGSPDAALPEPAPASCATDPGLCPDCNVDADCADDVDCTEDLCQARGCVHVPRDTACPAGSICDPRDEGGCIKAKACGRDGDCADDDACTLAEYCDMSAAVCRFILLDNDGDRHVPAVCGGDDCDDTDATKYPGALDICDGEDNDCNGSVDPSSAALLCGPGRVCAMAACYCRAGTYDCFGRCLLPEQFVDDEQNCGECGKVCGIGHECLEGACVDIDECADQAAEVCGEHGSCTNGVGGFTCSCEQGFGVVQSGGICEDIDECGRNTDGCDTAPDACSNTEGGFECDCPSGYGGDGLGEGGCLEDNECLLGTHDCPAAGRCVNIPTSFACSRPVVQISLGYQFGCARFNDGAIKCWGTNYYGQHGVGDMVYRGDGPGEMGDQLPEVQLHATRPAIALSVGNDHACAVLNDGSVRCWGYNDSGQLGLGDYNNRGDQAGEMGAQLPAVDLGQPAKTVAAGGQHTCAILDDDSVKCWGYNGAGQLGIGNQLARGDQPGEMGDALPAVDLGGRTARAIAAGASHTCALLDDSSVKCWGGNGSGQLGRGDNVARGDADGEMGTTLTPIDLGTGRTAKAIAAGGVHTCVVLNDNRVKCWGGGSLGQLGLESQLSRGDQAGEMGDSLPSVNLGSGRTAKSIAVYESTSCAVLDDDKIKCWGNNTDGQLGIGNYAHRGAGLGTMGDSLPSVNLGAGVTARAVATGALHTCALLANETVMCWGTNEAGELGLGTTVPTPWPGTGDQVYGVQLGGL